MALKNKIKKLIRYDNEIEKKQGAQRLNVIAITGILISISFLVLSIANIVQNSTTMLILTSVSAILVLISTIIGVVIKREQFISRAIVICCTAIFTAFVIIGGNNGFAALWLTLIPCISILLFDMKVGFICSTYFLIFLIIFFWTPLRSCLLFDYGTTFYLRFPLLYLISYCFTLYLCVVTKRQQYMLIMREKQLEIAKEYDRMTGILNRSRYEEMLATEFKTYDSIGVMFFDVNGLKYINDNFGHSAGDFTIRKAVKSIEASMNENMMLFRIGGDEFLLISPNSKKEDCETFIASWKNALAEMNRLQKDYTCSVSVGFAYAQKPYDINKLIEIADQAMYEQKKIDKQKNANNNR